jgi:hypothetical protein
MIRSKPSTKESRENHDKIFGKYKYIGVRVTKSKDGITFTPVDEWQKPTKSDYSLTRDDFKNWMKNVGKEAS